MTILNKDDKNLYEDLLELTMIEQVSIFDPEDRKRIEDGEILPNELDLMNKPYAYVMIPNIVHSNEDDRANLTQIVKELEAEENAKLSKADLLKKEFNL